MYAVENSEVQRKADIEREKLKVSSPERVKVSISSPLPFDSCFVGRRRSSRRVRWTATTTTSAGAESGRSPGKIRPAPLTLPTNLIHTPCTVAFAGLRGARRWIVSVWASAAESAAAAALRRTWRPPGPSSDRTTRSPAHFVYVNDPLQSVDCWPRCAETTIGNTAQRAGGGGDDDSVLRARRQRKRYTKMWRHIPHTTRQASLPPCGGCCLRSCINTAAVCGARPRGGNGGGSFSLTLSTNDRGLPTLVGHPRQLL